MSVSFKKLLGVFLVLFISLILIGPAAAQVTIKDGKVPRPTIMKPDAETLKGWMDHYESATTFTPDFSFDYAVPKASQSLLNLLQYTPSQRDQGSCGNCWAWAGTGALAIALNVQESIMDRLSVQYVSECNGAKSCCDGGNANDVATFYQTAGQAVAWSNTNAEWRNGDGTCKNDCGTIGTTTQYDVLSMTAQKIQTTGVTQAQAISNIKAALNSNKAVFFGFFLATQSDWDDFFDFWYNAGSTAAFNYDPYSGHSTGSGFGGHAVLIVGYEDTGTNRYWIALNSWGTAYGARTDGTFRINMDINYNSIFFYGATQYPLLTFYVFNTQFGAASACPSALTPTSNSFTSVGGTGSFSVTADAGCSWAATTLSSWVSITSGANGSGNGTVQYNVNANTSTGSRMAYINVGGQQFTITQAGTASGSCTYTINPPINQFNSAGGTGTFEVSVTGTDCDWTALSNDNWITITSGANGVGNGIVTYTVDAYTGLTPRTGTLTVNSETHTVNQNQPSTGTIGFVSNLSSFSGQEITVNALVFNTESTDVTNAEIWSLASTTNFPCSGTLTGYSLAQIPAGVLTANNTTTISDTSTMLTSLTGSYYIINLLVRNNYYVDCNNQGLYTFTPTTTSSSEGGGGCFLKMLSGE